MKLYYSKFNIREDMDTKGLEQEFSSSSLVVDCSLLLEGEFLVCVLPPCQLSFQIIAQARRIRRSTTRETNYRRHRCSYHSTERWVDARDGIADDSKYEARSSWSFPWSTVTPVFEISKFIRAKKANTKTIVQEQNYNKFLFKYLLRLTLISYANMKIYLGCRNPLMSVRRNT